MGVTVGAGVATAAGSVVVVVAGVLVVVVAGSVVPGATSGVVVVGQGRRGQHARLTAAVRHDLGGGVAGRLHPARREPRVTVRPCRQELHRARGGRDHAVS